MDSLPAPRIVHVGTVPSVLDSAHALIAEGCLGFFESVVAEAQTSGRGSHRRVWHSPAGNVYAAVRLPLVPPFVGTEAAVAVGAWIAEGLVRMGYPAYLKWPNDVAVVVGGRPRKVCGTLLEERGGALVAGVGVNVLSHPPAALMREDTALEAASLAEAAPELKLPEPDVEAVWTSLVNGIQSFYSLQSGASYAAWLATANARLLWRGRKVTLVDGDVQETGLLEGIGPEGALLLQKRGAPAEFHSGSIRLNA